MINIQTPHVIKWDGSFDIGIKSIDLQHKQLSVLMNELVNVLLLEDFPTDRIEYIINELIDFTVYHLDFEADCLFRFEYPDVYLHLEEHELFKEKINLFRNRIFESSSVERNDRLHLLEDLWQFLYVWLKEHIVDSDMKFVELLHANGMR